MQELHLGLLCLLHAHLQGQDVGIGLEVEECIEGAGRGSAWSDFSSGDKGVALSRQS